jgi:hypothetical protein
MNAKQNGRAAPVCPISRDQAVPGMPGRRNPPVPSVQDLPSALAAINQLAINLMQMLLPPAPNNVFPPFPFPDLNGTTQTPNRDGGGGKGKKPHWELQDPIQTMDVRVVDPDDTGIHAGSDKGNYVEYKMITMIQWIDWENNESFEWHHSPG